MNDSPPIRQSEGYMKHKLQFLQKFSELVDLKAREIARDRNTCVLTKAMLDPAIDEAVRGAYDVEERLDQIKEIIDSVESRCLAADGPVTPTLKEMGEDELRKIYKLAGGKIKRMGMEIPRTYRRS